MHRGKATGAAAVKRKNAEQYSKELCDIMMVNPISIIDKEHLFNKIFEILDQDVIRSLEHTPLEVDRRLWYNTCNRFCPTTSSSKRVIDLISDTFYTQGKPVFHIEGGIITINIGLPRVLFFELLLYLIEKLNDKEYDKEYFEGVIATVNDSDNSGILSYGVSDIDYFMMVTNENVEKIGQLLRSIDSKFTDDAPRHGNYTLAHVISSYCNGKLIERSHRPSPSPSPSQSQSQSLSQSLSQSQSQSQSDSQPDLDPNSLMNVPPDWNGKIILATSEDIRRYNAHKISQEQRQQIEDTKKRDEEQVAKVRLERKEHERRMREKTEQKDTRPVCFYDPKCYQQDPAHWTHFKHPGQEAPVKDKGKGNGGRRRQSKRSKYNTVRCSPSSTKHTRHRSSTKRRTRRRRRH
jgi:hypothetical protein